MSGPLSAESLLFGLSKQSLEAFNQIRQSKALSEGVSAASIGLQPAEVGLLCSGTALICVPSPSGPKIIRELSRNELFGVTEVITQSPFEYEILTAGPCIVDFVAAEDFLHFLRSEPEFCFRLMMSLGTNLQRSYLEFTAAGH